MFGKIITFLGNVLNYIRFAQIFLLKFYKYAKKISQICNHATPRQ